MLDELVEEHPEFFQGNPFMQGYFKKELHPINIFSDAGRKLQMSDFDNDRFEIIIGVSGSGKSNSGAVFMEEFLKKNVPILVLDAKHEYYTLKELYKITVIGDYKNYDEKLSTSDPEALASRIVHERESMIISFAFADEKVDILSFSTKLLSKLYELEMKETYPIMIFIEEAQNYIPQYPSALQKPLMEIVKKIALMGRSIGLGACFISQRPQQLNKSIITQATHMILHKVVYPTDVDIYAELIPFERKVIDSTVSKLPKGKCVYVNNGKAAERQIRKKHSRDVASGPGYEIILNDIKKRLGGEEYVENNHRENGAEGQDTLPGFQDE